MCSGERSSSANGAMAERASPARGWSTSRSRVLSDWTMSGPSVTTYDGTLPPPRPAERSGVRSVLAHQRHRGDPVHREGSHLLPLVVEAGEQPAGHRHRLDDPLGRRAGG